MFRIGTPLFDVKGLQEFKRYASKMRYYYVDISDTGTARFSKSAANEFLTYVRNAFLTGKYQSRVPGYTPNYKKYKANHHIGSGRPKGILTEEMVGMLEAFRSRVVSDAYRRGHVVGIKTDKGAVAKRLSAFHGGRTAGKGVQPPRPIFSYALKDFLNEKFPQIMLDFKYTRYVTKGILRKR
jgi:hypothetical protein